MTYGLELEWADIDIRKKLPEGFSFSDTEKTIVNSDGHANHPKGLWPYGGEINTPVAQSPEHMIEMIRPLFEIFPEATTNYRESLHIHVAFPELQNLEFLKKSLLILDMSMKNLISTVYPQPEEFFEEADFECPIQKLRVRWMGSWKRTLCMDSVSVDDFCECLRKDKSGKVSFAIPNRYAVNYFSIKKHGTLEFRLIPATVKILEIYNAMNFVGRICQNLIDGVVPDYKGISKEFPLPPPQPFISKLEEGWKNTNAEHI